MSLLRTLRVRFLDALAAVTDDAADDPTLAELAAMVRPADRFGDYQANMAMPLGKRLGRNPQVIAQQLIDAVDVADLCEPPEIAGPGFINLRLRDDVLAARATAMLGDDRLGVDETTQPRTVIVDFSSPNVAKPMHVGHLRSTVIGDALQRTLRRLGHRVTSDNHIGDWGTQFGMILWGHKHLLDEAAYREKPVEELARLYRTVNRLIAFQAASASLDDLRREVDAARRQADAIAAEPEPDDSTKDGKKQAKQHRKAVAKAAAAHKAAASRTADAERTIAELPDDLRAVAESHDDIATLARAETAKLHAGDEENLRLWREFLPHCLAALQSVYDRLGVRFDQTKGESHFQPRLGAVVDRLTAAGLATESDGAVVVFPENATENDAPLIVRKTDGAFTYATTDLATIEERVDDEGADQILYVVDARQGEHFGRVFETARRLGSPYDAVGYEHVSFGTVLGEDGRPFKTRSGDTVGLESLLDEAVVQAQRVVDENEAAKPDEDRLPDDERRRVAELVGLGGIKYADLRHNRESDYKFDWSKMLAKNGDTATYMQYAYARTRGILRKAAAQGHDLTDGPIALDEPAERGLALKLLQYPEALEAVGSELRPHLLTTYLFELAGTFSTFFEQCPVLKADSDQVRASRLRLVELTGRVIREGLSLLGIETAERM